jgi:uncharacterized protein YwbE
MMSIENDGDFEWYKNKSCIIGVREKRSGGFSIKVNQYGTLEDFRKLLGLILDFYRYQYMTFDPRGLKDPFTKELNDIGFRPYQRFPLSFQERPKIGAIVLIAIKPYVGRYEKGKIKRVLTGKPFHPRGFKVMLANKEETIGRIATIRKKGHKHTVKSKKYQNKTFRKTFKKTFRRERE